MTWTDANGTEWDKIWWDIQTPDLPPAPLSLRLRVAWAAIRGRSIVFRLAIRNGNLILARHPNGAYSAANHFIRDTDEVTDD